MRKVQGVPRSLDPMHSIVGFWDASLHKVAPPLRTTFGNFATVNLVDRFQIRTSGITDRMVWIPWTASPLAAIVFNTVDASVSSTPLQYIFKVLAPNTNPGTSVPKAIRPLRSSFRITSLTRNINTASAVYVLSYDNALNVTATFGATATTPVQISGGTTGSLRDMVLESPETKIYPLTKFVEPHTFVSVPCSWPDYNRYHNFTAFRHNVADAGDLTSGDLYAMTAREDTPFSAGGGNNDTVSYPYTAAATMNLTAGFAEVPAMRGHLLYIPSTDVEQLIEIELFRQVGCRFVSNTLGHSFHHTPTAATQSGETSLLNSIQTVSSNASAAFKTAALDLGAGYASIAGTVKAIASDANSAMGILSTALRFK